MGEKKPVDPTIFNGRSGDHMIDIYNRELGEYQGPSDRPAVPRGPSKDTPAES